MPVLNAYDIDELIAAAIEAEPKLSLTVTQDNQAGTPLFCYNNSALPVGWFMHICMHDSTKIVLLKFLAYPLHAW